MTHKVGRPSEPVEDYQLLFNSIDQGFCVIEMIFDERDRPVDYRFLEVNNAFEEQTGLTNATGRRVLELVPGLDKHWFEFYGRIARTRSSERFTNQASQLGRWFDVFAFPIGPPDSSKVAVLFHDITRRKEAEGLAAAASAALELATNELRASEEHFRRLADIAPVLIWLTDSDNQGEYMNAEYTRFLDRRMEDLLGGGWQEFLHPEDAADYFQSFVACASRRERFQSEFRFLRKDGDYRWMRTVAVPRFQGSTYLGYAGVTSDIHADRELAERQQEREAAERQARRRAELVNQVVLELENLEGVEDRAARLIEIMVPAVVDFASVEIPGMATVVSLGEVQAEGGISLPLGQGAGSLRLGFHPDRDVSPADQYLAVEVADRGRLSLANALLRREEHRVVERLQQALLPEAMLDRPEAAVAAHYQAGSGQLEVGGDWYDSFELPSGRMGFVVGDVVGHGLEAAAAMGRMRVALAALAGDTNSPGALLTKVDRFARGPNGCDFATVFYAIVDPGSGELRYASAGHPPPLVVSPEGDSRWLEEGRSIPLGVSDGSRRPEATTILAPGSLVVFYSDGLIERRGEPLSLGLTRLEQAVQAHREAFVEDLSRLLVTELRLEGEHEDDTVVMCVRYLGSIGPRFDRLFPARASELSHIRAAIREWQRDRGLSEDQEYRLILAVGEACSNSVLHAYVGSEPGEIKVQIRQEVDELVVRVRDFGKWRHPNGSLEGGGRGTAIMKRVTEGFRRGTNENGTVVDFRLPIGGPS